MVISMRQPTIPRWAYSIDSICEQARRGRVESAQSLSAAAGDHPGDITLAKAWIAIRGGNWNAALALLRAQPDHPQCQSRLLEMLVAERQVDAQRLQALCPPGNAHPVWQEQWQVIWAHTNGDFAAAAALARAAGGQFAEVSLFANHLGRALHNLGERDAALHAFEAAVASDPFYPEALNNLGHALRAAKQYALAEQAFSRALAIAPDFRQARFNLGIVLYQMERGEPALHQFAALYRNNDNDYEAGVNLALTQHFVGQLPRARATFERVLHDDPNNQSGWFYYGLLLDELMDTTGALSALGKALELAPNDVDALAAIAGVNERCNALDAARQFAARGMALDPGHPQLLIEAAKIYRRLNQTKEALVLLHRITPSELAARVAQDYYFTLADVLDALDQFDAAYTAYSEGNALAARSIRRTHVDMGEFDRRITALLQWLNRGAPAGWVEADNDDRGADLCFLVGFPRSGTTLLDTMLAANSAIVTIEELPTFEHAMASFAKPGESYVDQIQRMDAATAALVRRRYREQVAAYIPDRNGRLIIDKLPMRSLHAGIIRRLFPDARFVFAARHPCDVLMSNFKQQYAVNAAFVHFDTLSDCADTYLATLRVWWLSNQVLGCRAHVVRYESLVADAAAELAALCAFLDVAYRPTMLDRDTRLATRERVRTNSYHQVAQDIYLTSAQRWLGYRQYLEPHLPALRPAIAALGYPDPGVA